jgi:hypothetical protein
MPRRGTRTGSAAAASQKSSGSTSGNTSTMYELNTISEFAKAIAAVSPTDCEIAMVAYQLWLSDGCPVGLDQEHWFRAEEMLKHAFVGKRRDEFRRSSISRCDTGTQSGLLFEFGCKGHWEVWESEWGGARWTWDYRAAPFA